MRHKERERGRDIGRERSRLHAGSLMQDLIPGLQDHALGLKADAQLLSHLGVPGVLGLEERGEWVLTRRKGSGMGRTF